jgi:hypothetical protein
MRLAIETGWSPNFIQDEIYWDQVDAIWEALMDVRRQRVTEIFMATRAEGKDLLEYLQSPAQKDPKGQAVKLAMFLTDAKDTEKVKTIEEAAQRIELLEKAQQLLDTHRGG